MFRHMCKQLNLVYDSRTRYTTSNIGNSTCPFVTIEEVNAIFKRHAQHLKRISSISHGKGILNKAQFAAALAQIAVTLLREQPWCNVYKEDWHCINAIFSRLDINNSALLRKRLRGRGAFSRGDGDLQGRNEKKRNGAALGLSGPTALRSGFSFPLRTTESAKDTDKWK